MIKKYIKNKLWLIQAKHRNRKIDMALAMIKNQWEYHIDDISEKIFNKLVECEKCGCLLKREVAVKGEPIIKDTPYWYMKSADPDVKETYIHTPHYCKVHALKTKK